MKKILIFTAGFGEGHNTAARSVREALELLEPDEVEVQVIDLFETCYGKVNELARKAYITAINRAPRAWGKFYNWVDSSPMLDANLSAFKKMRDSLEQLLLETAPDAVVCTYPIYNYLINEIFSGNRFRRFVQITVVTDSISINSVWYKGISDFYLVPNAQTGEVLEKVGMPKERIKILGFPVKRRFAELAAAGSHQRPLGQTKKVLYLINSGKKQAPQMLRELLKIEDIELCITVGRDEKLREQVETAVRSSSKPVTIHGWTNDMPELLHEHHLVITKAGGATIQEAIASRCPVIISQIVPGQEEGNARLILDNHCGAQSTSVAETVQLVKQAFQDDNKLWKEWYENLGPLSKPSASLDIARFVLDQAAQKQEVD